MVINIKTLLYIFLIGKKQAITSWYYLSNLGNSDGESREDLSYIFERWFWGLFLRSALLTSFVFAGVSASLQVRQRGKNLWLSFPCSLYNAKLSSLTFKIQWTEVDWLKDRHAPCSLSAVVRSLWQGSRKGSWSTVWVLRVLRHERHKRSSVNIQQTHTKTYLLSERCMA